MKKIIALSLVLLIITSTLISCASGAFPSNITPSSLYATIRIADGEIVNGKVQYYHRYNESCIEIMIDEKVYYVHPVNITLIDRK